MNKRTREIVLSVVLVATILCVGFCFIGWGYNLATGSRIGLPEQEKVKPLTQEEYLEIVTQDLQRMTPQQFKFVHPEAYENMMNNIERAKRGR